MNPERLVLFQAIARAWPRDTCRTLYQVHVSLNHDLPAIIDIQSLRTGLASEAATVYGVPHIGHRASDIGHRLDGRWCYGGNPLEIVCPKSDELKQI